MQDRPDKKPAPGKKSAGKKPAPVEPPAPVEKPSPEKPAPEDPETTAADKANLITHIRLCVDAFPKKLVSMQNLKLDKMSLEELERTHDEIKYIMGSKQNLRMAVGSALMAIESLEHIACTFTPLKIKGLSDAFKDEDTLDDLKYICIKNGSGLQTSPEQRLGFTLLTRAYGLHQFNSMQAQPAQTDSVATVATVVPPSDEKFDDL